MPLPRNQIGALRIELQQVDSTNNYATALLHEGMAQHGTAIRAIVQTGGKGQRNRTWSAAPGENLTVSVVLHPGRWPGLPPFLLSKTIAVGIYQFFGDYAGEETSIKWPNDLYWRDRKAGGILIENIYSGHTWKYAIVGIGININQTVFNELGAAAVSLKQITGLHFSLETMEQQLYEKLSAALDRMESAPGSIEDMYARHLYKRGETARFRKDNRVFDAVVNGVSAQGDLIVQHVVEERFAVGEVEWVR